MSRLVILSLGQGNLNEGFLSVTAQVGEQGNPYRMKFTASLPSSPEIAQLYRNWQSLYSAFYQRLRLRLDVPESEEDFEIEEGSITNFSEVDIIDLCHHLSKRINAWLNSTEFRNIDQQLRTQLEPSEEIRFTVETNDHTLRRLPWHLWNFFEDYPNAEVALSTTDYQKSNKWAYSHKDKIRILAIFGNSKEIDIGQDRIFLERLSERAEIEFLVEPSLGALNDQLWQQGWDILFFAGHSSSKEKGLLHINQTEAISLEKLKYGLKQAISGGLQLAIFNSCDSLCLGEQLQDLHIPQVIVMREPVPDVVAQEFLKYFLAEFSQGQSLYAAVRYARERLQVLEADYPCATWLPVICQNPSEPPMVWLEPTRNQKLIDKQKLAPRNHRMQILLIVSLVVATLVMGVRHLGILQPWELDAYEQLMIQRKSHEKPDPRLLIVTIDDADIQYQNQRKMDMRWSLSDEALAELLQKLEQYQPSSIGIDIYRDFPVHRNHPELKTRLRQDKRLFAVCKVSAPDDDAPDGIIPPPEVSQERLGFSDFVADSDEIARRQLLQMAPPLTSPCAAKQAFSLKLALDYLGNLGYKEKINSQGDFQIGDVIFKQLKSHSSGYQGIDASGYQLLLNYRSLPDVKDIAPQIPLRKILQNQIKPELIESVKNRIVLIGVTAISTADDWKTPYRERVPGVFVQAQMISQLLSAVLDHRPMLWWWSEWMEMLWVWLWSLVGGILAWRIRRPLYVGLATGTGLLTLGSICSGIFKFSGWIPLIPPALAFMSCAIVVKLLHNSEYPRRSHSALSIDKIREEPMKDLQKSN
jgi:CHASE2 domain-containing sensor protein